MPNYFADYDTTVNFISEEIFSYLEPEQETIMYAAWPTYDEAMNFPEEEEEVERMKEAIRGIRGVRLQMNVPAKQKTEVMIVSASEKVRDTFTQGAAFLAPLASATKVTVFETDEAVPQNAVSIPITGGQVRIPLDQLVDMEAEKQRLLKEKKRLEGELKRVAGKLSNQGFLAKAPAALVEEERAKQAKYQSLMDEVEKSLAALE